jgi:hypothetical protein
LQPKHELHKLATMRERGANPRIQKEVAILADTNWINLLSLTNLSASPYQFLDPAGGDQPARFYRAFMQ